MKSKSPLNTHTALWKTLFAAVAILTAVAAQTQAIVILGNSTDTGGNQPIGSVGPFNFEYAAAFTMPGQNYTLTDVQLLLGGYSGPSEAAVGLYLDNAGEPGSLFALLNDPPALIGEPRQLYTFLPAGTVTLAASTKYWLLVSGEAGDFFNWALAFDTPMGVATFNEYLISGDGGSTYLPGATNVRFTINGEPVVASVPDGGSTAMLLGIGLLAFVFASCRLRQGASAVRAVCAIR